MKPPRPTLLRQLRKTRDLSLHLVSYHTGISTSQLSHAERGLTTLTEENLAKLAKFYRVPKGDLLRAATLRPEVALD